MPELRPPPRLRSPNRQTVLDATPIDGLLDSDHQARVVWDFSRGRDITPPTDPLRARHGRPGRAALDPRLAIALWRYATLEGVGSARQRATPCTRHNAFRWRRGGVTVNHHTRADFRVESRQFLDRLLTHSVALLRDQGRIDRNRVAWDGTRVRAGAGAASVRRQPTRDECLIDADDQIARLKAELDDDPSASSRRQAAARERAARERAERVRALEAVTGCGVTVYAPVPQPKDASRDRHPRLPGDRPVIAAWRERMGTAGATAIYTDRAATVEGGNAQARSRVTSASSRSMRRYMSPSRASLKPVASGRVAVNMGGGKRHICWWTCGSGGERSLPERLPLAGFAAV